MTTQEAKNNIGQQFKLKDFSSHDGLLGHFDTIRQVNASGEIEGDFLTAAAEDCRLKQDQPQQLKQDHEQIN